MGRPLGAKMFVPALIGLVCGCYLFSDEPKARKKTDGGADESAQARTTQDAPPGEDPQPTPEGEANDCPELLTGVETKARTIAAGCPPVHVRGQYRIDGGTLEIGAGVQLRFEPGAVLEVGRDKPGTLKVMGTPEQPVRLVADSVSDSGGWQGVRLYAQADGSSLSHVEIASAGTADQAALWIVATQVQVEGLTVRSSAGLALELAGERGVEVLGAELSGVGVVARATPAAAAGLHSLTLERKAQVAIAAGLVKTTLEWPANPYRIEGLIRVEGETMRPAQLSLAPGTTLHFMPDARIVIGGFGPGTFSASAGTPDATGVPEGVDQSIRMRAAEQQQGGGWGGLHVQDQGQLALSNVELVHGGARDEGVILAEGSASLSLDGCTFRSDLVGVELRGAGVTIESLSNNAFIDVPVAIRTTPALLGKLGSDNRYDASARIHVERGKVEADATWAAHTAPIVIHGDVFVDKGATLSIEPGARLEFDPGVVLGVGYYEAGTLELRGTEDAPIVLDASPPTAQPPDPLADPLAEPPAPEPWGGVVLGAHAVKTRFEHVHLRGTGNAAGIELRDSADATLVNVDCAQCAGATVKWGCESTIGNIGVTASEGTPTPMAAPTQCK